MLLSIVMIIKNEEKHLKKTLNALVPLMKDIESELIILDTGSTDNSISIAQEYTKGVYYSQWNNNFADMRNKSISYATGEWILILDADEELIKFDKLKKFFSSNLHKEFSSATIELKNIHFKDKEEYTLGSVVRMFKRTRETKYIGAIHEQPVFSAPIFNDVATFNHYGYIGNDIELNKRKRKRNKEIIVNELKKNSDNPYMNYQLGKEFKFEEDCEKAISYLEKSKKIYKEKGNVPIFVTVDLIELYLITNQLYKCEKECEYYIKKDEKNIDIYYYLAEAQKLSFKYTDSINNYKKHIYLIENYDISTQACNIECNCTTISLKKNSEISIIKNYFKVENYDLVILLSQQLENKFNVEIYSILIESLYKTNNIEKIKSIYYEICKTQYQKNKYERELENFIFNYLDEDEKRGFYSMLSKFDGDYGTLNKIRIEEVTEVKVINELLIKEQANYYGDVLDICLKNGGNIKNILHNVPYTAIEKYLEYFIKNKKENKLIIYGILLCEPLTLSKEITIFLAIAKVLLFNGEFVGEKYKNIFCLYVMYYYEYIKSLYKEELSDDEIINITNDIEAKFVLEFNRIEWMKKNNELQYIKELKSLLLNNQYYKKGINIFINEFQKEFNENKELKELKKKYKKMIEEKINSEDLDSAEKLINDYEEIFEYDDINNMKAIISICRNNIRNAEKYLKLAYCNNRYDEDTLFNIAYIKESQNDLKEAINFYNKLLNINHDYEIEKKVLELNNILNVNNTEKIIQRKIYIEQLIENGELDKAEEQLKIYKYEAPEDISIYSMEGIIFMQRNEYYLACELFLKGLDIEDNNVDLLYNIAFVSSQLGNVKEAIFYYNRCLNLTKDYELIEEIKANIINLENLIAVQKEHTLIYIESDKKEMIYNIFNEKAIIVRVNKETKYDTKYYDEKREIEVYETNENNVTDSIKHILRINSDSILVFNDIRFKKILQLKELCPIIFYTNENLYLEVDDYLNHNILQYFEKEICDNCNYIFTDNIEVYYYKKILEKRENIFFVNKIDENMKINSLLYNSELYREYFQNSKNYILDNEELKCLYTLLESENNSCKDYEVSKKLYEKYNKEQYYQIYLFSLIEKKDYKEIVITMINSVFCDEIYKAEVLYLYSIEKNDLIEFIVNISIKNYTNVELILDTYNQYKMAIYNYELSSFDKSYEKMIQIIKEDNQLKSSPIINRNMSFLLYKKRNLNYKTYYRNYKKLISSVYEINQ